MYEYSPRAQTSNRLIVGTHSLRPTWSLSTDLYIREMIHPKPLFLTWSVFIHIQIPEDSKTDPDKIKDTVNDIKKQTLSDYDAKFPKNKKNKKNSSYR